MSSGVHSILLIDSDSEARAVFAACLDECRFRVHVASDGEVGLSLYHRLRPDLVVCDVDASSLSGYDILQAIKADASGTSVIVSANQATTAQVLKALRLGSSDFLIKLCQETKKLDTQQLIESINRCLKQGKLSREKIDYRQQLEITNNELQQSLAVLEQDQQAGRLVQLKMLPPTPKQFGNFHFSHKIIPSLFLSGDFIDYFTVGEQHLLFCIADVSGHGASSAFVTVMLKNLLARKRSDYLHLGDDVILSPIRLLERANKELLQTGVGKHATLCVGVIDLQSNLLNYSVAGHLPLPILVSAGVAQYLKGEGMPVGLFEHAEYTENTLGLPEHFMLCLFTDGILEVMQANGVVAQEQCLLANTPVKADSAESVVEALGLEGITDAPDDIGVLTVSR